MNEGCDGNNISGFSRRKRNKNIIAKWSASFSLASQDVFRQLHSVDVLKSGWFETYWHPCDWCWLWNKWRWYCLSSFIWSIFQCRPTSNADLAVKGIPFFSMMHLWENGDFVYVYMFYGDMYLQNRQKSGSFLWVISQRRTFPLHFPFFFVRRAAV